MQANASLSAIQEHLRDGLLEVGNDHSDWQLTTSLWFVALGLAILLLVLAIVTAQCFRERLYKTYSYFLYCQDPVIEALAEQCHLAKKLAEGRDQADPTQVERERLEASLRDKGNDDEEGGELRRMKMFKGGARRTEVVYCLQLAGVVVVLIALAVGGILFSDYTQQEHEKLLLGEEELFRMEAQSSLHLMNCLLRYELGTSPTTDEFPRYTQHVDGELLSVSRHL